MSRFCLPRDIYHGKGSLEELKNLKGKKHFLELKQDQYKDAQNQIKAEEDRKYEKEKELEELIEEMQDEADIMAFEEHAFMKEELENSLL